MLVTALSEVDLNRLLDAALEFGSNWRRPLGDLAAESFPDQPEVAQHALATAVENARSAIETHIGEIHIRVAGNWTRAEERQADAWIANRFPWMTPESRRRARSQGQYYAWHDRG